LYLILKIKKNKYGRIELITTFSILRKKKLGNNLYAMLAKI
jgi:hypothetical protein